MLLAALVGSGAGSADGVVVAAAGGDAGVVVAVSFFRVSAAGAVTISDGLVFAASGTVAVVSSLKSLMVGGGRLAGSGRGIAASIASSAALRAGSAWASAEVADTVRKVAATAISTRSNPARFFERSRIVTPLGEAAPAWNSSCIVRHSFRLHATIHAQTIHVALASNQRHPGNSRQTDFKRSPFQRIARFCHAPCGLSVTAKQRFKCSGIADVLSLFVSDTAAPHSSIGLQFASFAPPAAESSAVASSSLR